MDTYLTKERFEVLTKELEQLKTVGRKEAAEALSYAKSLGDLSENAEYHEARNRQGELEARIRELEGLLQNAVIASHDKKGIVEIGSKIVISKQGGAHVTYSIVGAEEADISQGKISLHSPIGKALVGKKKGDTVEVKTPVGTTSYTIISLS